MHLLRRLLLFQSFCLLIIICCNCAGSSSIKDQLTKTTITGSIANRDKYPEVKQISVFVRDFTGKRNVFSDSIHQDGTFKIVLELYRAQDVDIDPFVRKVFLQPGDSLHLNLDFDAVTEVGFSGMGQKDNQDLYKYLHGNYYIHDFYNSKAFRSTPLVFKSFADSMKNVMVAKRADFIRNYKPDQEIEQWTSDYITINYTQAVFDYLMRNNSLDVNTGMQIFNGCFSGIDSLYEHSSINTAAYDLLPRYFSLVSKKLFQGRKPADVDNAINDLSSYVILSEKSELFKEYLLGGLMSSMLYNHEIGLFEKHSNIIDHIKSSSIKTPLLAYYDDCKGSADNTKSESEAIFKKMEGTPGKAVIDSLIAKNKGKVIYIDCWATWCNPCLAEMKHSKSLQEQLKGKEVEFVFLCFNSATDNWKQASDRLHLGGSNVFCGIKQSGSIKAGFNFHSLPYYILINKKGEVIEHGNRIRPSNADTNAKIIKVLNEP